MRRRKRETITGLQLRRWREMKNLTRSQLLALLPSPQCAKSTERIAAIEQKTDTPVPEWLVDLLSTNKVRTTTISCGCDLQRWARADTKGQEQQHTIAIIDDVEEAEPPTEVCEVDEASFIARLLHRQGYECTPEDVGKWLDGETPPVEVAHALSSIKTNIGYLVRAAQAENVVAGMFGTMSLGGILKQEPVERTLQADSEIRRALGEREIEMLSPIRLPHRYQIILHQLCRSVRLDTTAFINLWLERSIESVLIATKIKTQYDDLGIHHERRKLFKFHVNRATLTNGRRQATVKRSMR